MPSTTPKRLTISLELNGRPVLVLGAGQVGLGKINKLLPTGAIITVVEPRPKPELAALAERGALKLCPQFFDDLLNDNPLVFIASSDEELNREVSEKAKAKNLWVCSAADQASGNFNLAAEVSRGDFTLCVSTGGASPALARQTALDLAAAYGPEYGRLTAILGGLRPLILASGLPQDERAELLAGLAADSLLLKALADGRIQTAFDLLLPRLAPLGIGGEAIFKVLATGWDHV